MICDKDCFRCKYQDCINDEMDTGSYREARQRERDMFYTPEQKKRAAQKAALAREIAALGITKAAAARLLGVSRTTVSFWCNGSVRCDVDAVIARLKAAGGDKKSRP